MPQTTTIARNANCIQNRRVIARRIDTDSVSHVFTHVFTHMLHTFTASPQHGPQV